MCETVVKTGDGWMSWFLAPTVYASTDARMQIVQDRIIL